MAKTTSVRVEPILDSLQFGVFASAAVPTVGPLLYVPNTNVTLLVVAFAERIKSSAMLQVFTYSTFEWFFMLQIDNESVSARDLKVLRRRCAYGRTVAEKDTLQTCHEVNDGFSMKMVKK